MATAAARPSRARTGILSVAALVVATLLLAAPAVWNGYPLLQYDTGGYLARYYEKYLVLARSTTFGLYLHLGEGWHFWPNVAFQSALAVWILALVLRVLGLARQTGGKSWAGPARLLAIVAALSIATALPWLAGMLLTDIFAGLGVLALHLLLFHAAALRRAERLGLVLVVAFAAASHSGTLALLLGLVVAAALAQAAFWALGQGTIAPLRRVFAGAAAIALGAAMLVATNFALSGRAVWTPGGFELSFGRMLQDGIVARYLDDNCDRMALKLCPYRRDLPATADEFFWAPGVFDRLGRFPGLRDEMRAIVLGSLAAYPGQQLWMALAATGKQLALVATGWGTHDDLPHTHGIFERFLPGEVAAMRAARQQQGQLPFDAINRLHVPAAYLSTALMLVLLALRLRPGRLARPAPGQQPPDPLALLAATVTLATLGNAAILGILSGPHDRYGARIAWLAVLVALCWAVEATRGRAARR